jgi:hypothetical protein
VALLFKRLSVFRRLSLFPGWGRGILDEVIFDLDIARHATHLNQKGTSLSKFISSARSFWSGREMFSDEVDYYNVVITYIGRN